MARVSVGEHAVTGPAERLLPHHRALLRDSAVSRDVWIGRGYRSIKTATTLRKAGFSEVQSSLVPGRFARKLGHALRFRLHRRYGPDGLYLDTLPDRKTKVNRWVVRRAGKH